MVEWRYSYNDSKCNILFISYLKFHDSIIDIWLQTGYLSATRCLHLQEYQSKKLMQDNGISVQKFVLVSNQDEAAKATDSLGECHMHFRISLFESSCLSYIFNRDSETFGLWQ